MQTWPSLISSQLNNSSRLHQMLHICIRELGYHWSRLWLIATVPCKKILYTKHLMTSCHGNAFKLQTLYEGIHKWQWPSWVVISYVYKQFHTYATGICNPFIPRQSWAWWFCCTWSQISVEWPVTPLGQDGKTCWIPFGIINLCLHFI